MITLDRAIELMEAQVGELSGVTGVVLYADDILHYLRELKLFRQTPIMQGIHKAQKECALYPVDNLGEDEPDSNPALSWEQLKQMEGKPVWVEDNIDEPEDTTKYWAIYMRIEKTQETEYALLSDFYYDKAQYGKTWQAYRKELP